MLRHTKSEVNDKWRLSVELLASFTKLRAGERVNSLDTHANLVNKGKTSTKTVPLLIQKSIQFVGVGGKYVTRHAQHKLWDLLT